MKSPLAPRTRRVAVLPLLAALAAWDGALVVVPVREEASCDALLS